MPKLVTPVGAVCAMFALNGGLFGVWASRIPAFTAEFALTPGTLGLLLLCLAGGAILSFPVAGRLSDRMGAAALTKGLAPLYVAALCLLAVAPNVPLLAAALALYGAFYGAMDVAMNSWGAEVEQARQRHLMSRFHALYSLGAGLGAATGYAAVSLGIAPGLHFLCVGGAATALAWVFARVPWASARAAADEGPRFAIPRGPLLIVGLVALAAAVGEGAMADWSAVFLADVTGTSDALAALGYACFSVAMVVTRLSGPALIATLGPARTAQLSGGFAAAGAALIVWSEGLPVALLGFGLLGAGYATIMPLAFSRAAAGAGRAQGRAIASVATLGYGGMLLGPPLIGALAELVGLRHAFLLLAGLSLLIVLLSNSLQPDRSAGPDPAPGRNAS